jgi:hypothetical protein
MAYTLAAWMFPTSHNSFSLVIGKVIQTLVIPNIDKATRLKHRKKINITDRLESKMGHSPFGLICFK